MRYIYLTCGAQVLNSRTNCRQVYFQFFYGLKSFSLSFFFLLLIVVTAENPCSYRYDVDNGSKIVIAFINISRNSVHISRHTDR